MLTVSADQNTHILVNGKITDHGKRRFEWQAFRRRLKKKIELKNFTLKFTVRLK